MSEPALYAPFAIAPAISAEYSCLEFGEFESLESSLEQEKNIKSKKKINRFTIAIYKTNLKIEIQIIKKL